MFLECVKARLWMHCHNAEGIWTVFSLWKLWVSCSISTTVVDSFKQSCLYLRTYLHIYVDTCTHIVTDWGVCSWPWQLLGLTRADRHIFVTSNRCVLSENMLGCSAACGIIQLLYVMFLFRAVHKFDFMLLVYMEHVTYGDQCLLKKLHLAAIQTNVFDSI
jgi:hypothetical protein